MTEAGHYQARFQRQEDGWRATLQIALDETVERVWRALTDPADLPQWLAPGQIELKVGGTARLDFIDSGVVIDSTVRALEPLRLLDYSWSGPGEPERPMRWTLQPNLWGTQLTLELALPRAEDVARSTAGWAAHLEMLAALLAGAPIRFPFESFKAAQSRFRDQIAAIA